MAKRKAKNVHLVEPTWGQSDDGGPPLTELTSASAGARRPSVRTTASRCRSSAIRYAHPTGQAQPGRRAAGRGRMTASA